MHHALEIQEILLNILDHCRRPKTYSAELAVLARTCRMFKEPALDVLWQELFDLSPLARCLPDASHLAYKSFAFNRPLTQTEWDTLQSYTRRIRSIREASGLGRKSIRVISEPHTTKPLIQNLQHLRFTCTLKTAHLLRLPLPSIISLDIEFFNSHLLHNVIPILSKFSPTLCNLSIQFYFMDAHNFVRLSHTMITRLQLHVNDVLTGQVAASNLLHLFPHLLDLTLFSQPLTEISPFLAIIRIPALTGLRISIRDCPPAAQDVSSFWASLQASGVSSAFKYLSLFQLPSFYSTETGLALGFQDLRPCMAFNLCHISLNMQCRVDLDDNDILTLASAWPHLEHLFINELVGWNTTCGLTPSGLVRLLKKCPLLRHVALVLDTRGVIPRPEPGESHQVSLLPNFSIDIVDSTIEADTLPAIADFFTRFSPRVNPLLMAFWSHPLWMDPAIQELYYSRWLDVQQRIDKATGKNP